MDFKGFHFAADPRVLRLGNASTQPPTARLWAWPAWQCQAPASAPLELLALVPHLHWLFHTGMI